MVLQQNPSSAGTTNLCPSAAENCKYTMLEGVSLGKCEEYTNIAEETMEEDKLHVPDAQVPIEVKCGLLWDCKFSTVKQAKIGCYECCILCSHIRGADGVQGKGMY